MHVRGGLSSWGFEGPPQPWLVGNPDPHYIANSHKRPPTQLARFSSVPACLCALLAAWRWVLMHARWALMPGYWTAANHQSTISLAVHVQSCIRLHYNLALHVQSRCGPRLPLPCGYVDVGKYSLSVSCCMLHAHGIVCTIYIGGTVLRSVYVS